jgi:ribosomal protein S18 acetylase RimI-like enzyme
VRTAAAIREIAPDDGAGLKRFIRLEQDLHRDDPLFVSAIDRDEERFLSGKSVWNRGLEHALFIASNGRDVARCTAIINRRYQEEHHEPVGFIGRFAAAPEAENEVLELLSKAEEWLGRRGVTRVIAPYSSLADFGMLTADFDKDPIFPFRWQPPYYAGYIERAGYRPTYPWWSYRIDLRSTRYREVSRRAIEEARCEVRPIDKRKWPEEWALIADLFNRTFRDEWEFYPLSVEEWREFYDGIKPLRDPRQTLIAKREGEPVGFCIGWPDWTPLMRRAKGKTGPLAQLRFALGARRTRRAGLLIIGILPECRGNKIGQTLAATLYRRYEELGLEEAEYYIVNEDNRGSRSLAESFGGEGRRLYHVYDRRLD